MSYFPQKNFRKHQDPTNLRNNNLYQCLWRMFLVSELLHCTSTILHLCIYRGFRAVNIVGGPMTLKAGMNGSCSRVIRFDVHFRVLHARSGWVRLYKIDSPPDIGLLRLHDPSRPLHCAVFIAGLAAATVTRTVHRDIARGRR